MCYIMNIKSWASILLIVFLTNCTNEQKNRWGEERWDNIPVIELTGELIQWDKPLYQEGGFVFIDEYVIFESDNDEFLFRAYRSSPDSLVYVGSFINQGRGPLELNTAELFYDRTTKTLTLVGYNPMGKSIRIPLQQKDNLFDHSTWTKDDYSTLPPIMAYRIIPVDDSVYITQPFDGQNSLFSFYNIGTGDLKHLNMPYPDNNSTVPLTQRAEAYIGQIRKHPTHHRFAYANSNSKLVMLFNVDNDSISQVSIPFHQIPEYVASGRDRVKYTANNDNGYQLAVTDSMVYCADPRIDRLDREASIIRNGFDAGYVREIFVMDWNGRPISRYRLDRPVCYIQPTPDNRYLYAFGLDNETLESHILKFRLP